MVYQYSSEVKERFDVVGKHKNSNFQLALDECLGIIQDYADDDGILAKAYYFAAEMSNLLSDSTNSEKYCELSIIAAKHSGNLRYLTLSTNLLALLYLNREDEAKAAEYLYEALSSAIRNQDDDLLDTIYTILGHTFMSVEDYTNALYYFRLGIDGFVKTYKNAKTLYAGTYGSRLFCCAQCYMALNNIDELEKIYNELNDVKFGEVLPLYAAIMTFLSGYLAYMKGDKTNAIPILQSFVTELSEIENVIDTFELLTYVYDVFTEYDLPNELQRILKLMEHYSTTIELEKCKVQYNTMLIKYCKYIGDTEGLLRAYDEYYEYQQFYNANSILQRQTNIMLRKRLFEETELNRKKIRDLQELSETDALTGLANRHSLVKCAKELFENSLKTEKEFGVILLDIDRYKGYNDEFGHLQGDECLKQVASVFKEVLHEFFCARYGGDEFICVFSGVTKEEIEGYCKLLRVKIEQLCLEHPKNVPYNIVTISQGVAVHIPSYHDDFAVFLHEADNSLYNCKESGRNSITFF